MCVCVYEEAVRVLSKASRHLTSSRIYILKYIYIIRNYICKNIFGLAVYEIEFLYVWCSHMYVIFKMNGCDDMTNGNGRR